MHCLTNIQLLKNINSRQALHSSSIMVSGCMSRAPTLGFRAFSATTAVAAAEVKRLGVVGAGQMVCISLYLTQPMHTVKYIWPDQGISGIRDCTCCSSESSNTRHHNR